jgi:predicted ATPase
MYRRIGWTLVNLKTVLKIEATGNYIRYTLPVSHGDIIFFSGSVRPEVLLEIYNTPEECAKAYNELAYQLTTLKELK